MELNYVPPPPTSDTNEIIAPLPILSVMLNLQTLSKQKMIDFNIFKYILIFRMP